MDWVLDWKVNFRGVLRSFSVISHGSWGQCVTTQFAFCALNFRANFHRVTKRLKSPIQVQHRECRNSTAATSYQATRIITLSFLLLTISAKKWEFKGFITASHKIQEKRGEKMKKKKKWTAEHCQFLQEAGALIQKSHLFCAQNWASSWCKVE